MTKDLDQSKKLFNANKISMPWHIFLKVGIFILLAYGMFYSSTVMLPTNTVTYGETNAFNTWYLLFFMALFIYVPFIVGYELAKLKHNFPFKIIRKE